jgi:hypothetical protein
MIISKATTQRNYAMGINQGYLQTQSNIVTLKERWTQSLASLPTDVKNDINSRLNAVIKLFQRRHPTITSFSDPDFRMCKAIPVLMSWLCLDTTIQRVLNINHVLSILENFAVYQVMPIQVYRADPADLRDSFDPRHEHWASWDGQHTAIALWIIATMIFKEDPDNIMIPVVEYDMRNAIERRTTFINNNSGVNTLGLSHYDLTSQMVFGVKLNGANDPTGVDVANKQDVLATYELFFTDSKRYDDHQPGAFTRVKDVMWNTHIDTLENVCVYMDQMLTYQSRAVNTKEFPIIENFFKMARAGGIDYTEEEIRSLADVCWTLFKGDFDEAGAYWAQVGEAYTNWHVDHYANWDEDERPGIRLNKDVPQGLTFFWFQLKHSWKNLDGNQMKLPRLNISTQFRPNTKDLF